MKDIESSQNKNFKTWCSLLDSKGVQTHQLAILAGKKVVMEALENHFNHVIALLMPPKPISDLPTVKETYRLSTKLFKDLDIFGTGFPLAVIKTPAIKKWSPTSVKGCHLLLMQQDPRNVGAILRSSAAFGVNEIILGPGCAHPFHPESLRAASGTIFAHTYSKLSSLTELSKTSTVGLDMTGENMADFIFPKDFVLIPGVEGPGLSKDFEPTRKVNIRISKNAESLNVMQATTIALYEYGKQGS